MSFAPGDLVHVKSLGKGTVREVRNAGRYLIELKGRSLVASADQLTRIEMPRKTSRTKSAPRDSAPQEYETQASAPVSIDLHGRTVAEAIAVVGDFLNRALLDGTPEVHIIHGRSGGKIKGALHAELARIGSIRGFRLDPRNAGVTIVQL